MKVWFNAIIFLGVLLIVLFILLLVYCCIKKGLCCCQKQPKREEAEDNEALLDTFEEEDDYSPYLPYSKVSDPSPVQPAEFNYVMTDQSDFHTSDDDLVPGLPATHMSVRTYAESIDTDSQFDKGELMGLYKKMKKDEFIDGCKLKLALLYSKTDLFLMLTVNELSGIPSKEDGGHDLVRVSITLLPEKKYRSKTKYQHVIEEVAVFNDSFKFSNVSRESLFSSAFRFRLYAKKSLAKEICIGEMIVQLADVAQRSGGFVTWKKFERKKNF